MKKILLILLLLCSTANAGDFGVITLRDSISAADTVGGTPRADTVYSKAYRLDGATNYQFFKNLYPDETFPDTAWVADTFFVDFQHSFDGKTWRTWLVDTAVSPHTLDSGWSLLNISSLDSVIGGFGRARLIHWDSLDAAGDHTGLYQNVYVMKLNLWINKIY